MLRKILAVLALSGVMLAQSWPPGAAPTSAALPVAYSSYTASKDALTVAASATDIATLTGNASNTVIVTRIQVTCTQTTAGIVDLQLIKRSTADSGGTTTGSPASVPNDKNFSGASSSVLTYTANATGLGTAVGNVDSTKVGCMATGTAAPNDIYIWTPARSGQSIVLRGTGDQLAINLGGVTVTGGSFNVTISWIETTAF